MFDKCHGLFHVATGTDSLSCPPKDNWWFIGAQSGVISTQNHGYEAFQVTSYSISKDNC